MLQKLKHFLSAERKELKQAEKTVQEINNLEELFQSKSDEELKGMTEILKERLSQGEGLEEILPEAFATVREAARRTIGLRHFDSQLLGGIILSTGNVAEMKTGEGKTLVATLPAYLHSLTGSVHVYTVNDYLAERDAEWMKPVFEFLGLTVGVVKTSSTFEERHSAYRKDVVYGTSNEFGFDLLRSNGVFQESDELITSFDFAIVDEADTILIDEARIPLTLSSLASKANEEYLMYAELAKVLEIDEDYEVDYETGQATLTESGIEKIETTLGIENLYDTDHVLGVHKIQFALISKHIFEKGRHYLIEKDELVMIDIMTGRLMPGRRFPDGLQQSLEAKEGLTLSPEFVVKGMTTYRSLLSLYGKVCGMTGTAKTEEEEFMSTYGLGVYAIPTNKDNIREDFPDVVYKTKEAKYAALIDEMKEVHETGRPILLGTTSVEESEVLSERLKEEGLEHRILNARNHRKEAEIIEQAGEQGAITVITNMAGRGTDIQLGEGVAELGGLHVIGTTRHENRRIDNQLRGRAGRQGDPGTTRIFVSLEDDLILQYGGEQVRVVLNKIKMSDDMPVDHPMVGKIIEQMQIQSEGAASSVRKFLNEFDGIIDTQRTLIYESRKKVLVSSNEDLKEQIFEMYGAVISGHVKTYCESEVFEEWDLESLIAHLNQFFFEEDAIQLEEIKGMENIIDIEKVFYEKAIHVYNRKEANVPHEVFYRTIRNLLLKIIDEHWMEHLSTLDYLRQGIGLKAKVGNPFVEFSIECHDLFDQLVFTMQEATSINTLLLEFRFDAPK